jgi:hypothetical protein
MVGSDPEKFESLATMTELPEDRQGTCRGDFSNASWSWNKTLESHLRKPDQPKMNIGVLYKDSGEKYEIFSRSFRNMMILETVAEHLSDRYVWRRPISLEMSTCDEPAARWDLQTQTIVVCYELGADFAQLYRDYATDPKAATKKRQQ